MNCWARRYWSLIPNASRSSPIVFPFWNCFHFFRAATKMQYSMCAVLSLICCSTWTSNVMLMFPILKSTGASGQSSATNQNKQKKAEDQKFGTVRKPFSRWVQCEPILILPLLFGVQPVRTLAHAVLSQKSRAFHWQTRWHMLRWSLQCFYRFSNFTKQGGEAYLFNTAPSNVPDSAKTAVIYVSAKPCNTRPGNSSVYTVWPGDCQYTLGLGTYTHTLQNAWYQIGEGAHVSKLSSTVQSRFQVSWIWALHPGGECFICRWRWYISVIFQWQEGPDGPTWRPVAERFTCSITSPKKESKYHGMKSFIAYQVTPSVSPGSVAKTPNPTISAVNVCIQVRLDSEICKSFRFCRVQYSNIQVSRRYKHFDWLHARLEEKYPCVVIPPLPDKQISGF